MSRRFCTSGNSESPAISRISLVHNGSRRSLQHARGDRPGPGDDDAQPDAGEHQHVVGLADGVGGAVVFDGGDRGAAW